MRPILQFALKFFDQPTPIFNSIIVWFYVETKVPEDPEILDTMVGFVDASMNNDFELLMLRPDVRPKE